MLPSVENVLGIYSNSTATHLEEGMSWYRSAHEFAESLDVNIERSAGIIAALSPMSKWENNKNKAAQFYNQNGIVCLNGKGNGIGLWKNVLKAQEIYAGAKPLDVLSGNKVRAFYLSILNPSDNSVPPVVDRHAFDIAVGRRTDDKTRGILSRKGMYDSFAEVYSEAAKTAGIGSAQMQAVTWVAWRDLHGIV